ncbi:MAG: aldo/keto reductase [Opitutaceae bacterium]
MSQSESRRTFLRHGLVGTAAAGVAMVGLQKTRAAEPPKPRRIDRRVLGRTGAEVSIIGLGLGSAFTANHDGKSEEVTAILQAALDRGINYWDTARSYGPSEELVGPMVEKHRSEIFLVSKTADRSYDGFKRELETSLAKLKTDHLDLYHLHNFEPTRDADLAAIEKGAVRAAREAKEQGIIRSFGVTGHSGPDILMAAIRQFDPDCIMTTFPCTRPDDGRYEDELLPLALENKMGVIAMKMVRRARDADFAGTDLIRYAISLPGISVANVGLDTIAHLTENAEMATNFEPMSQAARVALHQRITPLLAHTATPWERPGYRDGMIA